MAHKRTAVKKLHVSGILSECGACKQKGVPVIVIMTYMFNLMFSNVGMYRQMAAGSFKEGFPKNFTCRFLESRRINRQRLVLRLSAAVPQVFSQLKKVGQKAVARLKSNSKQC